MEWKTSGNNIIVKADNFSAAPTLDCGQAFRWQVDENGVCEGVAYGKKLRVSTDGDTTVFFNTPEDDFKNIWLPYFDLNRDYSRIVEEISKNEVLSSAAKFSYGIRILKQDPWETLCSFIISQNNNIPRIKGIISRLCENFGEDLGGYYSFPSAERIAELSLDDLAPLRCGFRNRYILDAAKKVASGEVNLEKTALMPTDDARAELMKICGVGEKVADCTLLFGMAHIDALPKDVWIKRALSLLFDGSLPEYCNPYAGIVQQYLFQYARMTKLEI